jgi:hypothetical protein
MAKKKEPITAATSMKPSSNVRMIQNFHLVWLDGSIDEVNDDDCRNSITKLRQVVNTVNTFTDVDECIDFITDIKDEMTFMIISEVFSPTIIPVLEAISQVNSVYIVCEDKAQQWSKLKGVYTDITSIYEALQQIAHDCDHNSVSIGFVKPSDGASKENLDQLDPSFMYTQILKEILLTIDFEQSHFNEFLMYCREQFVGNSFQLKNVDKIEKEPANHPDLAASYNNIGSAYKNMGEYSKALSCFERALGIWQRSLPPNHPHIQNVRKSIEIVKKKL